VNLKKLKIDPKLDLYKVKPGGEYIMVLNTRDWTQRIIDAKNGDVLYFMVI